MSEVYTYGNTARWTGRRGGRVQTEGLPEALSFSAPIEFHGEPGLWSPETLFLAAADTCFLTTFVAIAQFAKLDLAGLEIASAVRLERVPGQGYQFTELVLHPKVTLTRESDRKQAARLLEKAERSYIVARALQPSCAWSQPYVWAPALTPRKVEHNSPAHYAGRPAGPATTVKLAE